MPQVLTENELVIRVEPLVLQSINVRLVSYFRLRWHTFGVLFPKAW